MSKLAQAIADLIEKHFGGSLQEVDLPVEVNKAVDQEERTALFVVLEPQEGDTTDDLHGDTYTAKEVEKACHNFGEHCMRANLFHIVETDDMIIRENFIAPSAFTLDNGVEVKKGSWLQKWYFKETDTGDAAWEGVKAGEITGVSIQALATTEDLT